MKWVSDISICLIQHARHCNVANILDLIMSYFWIHAVNKTWQKWSSCAWWGSWIPRMRRKNTYTLHSIPMWQTSLISTCHILDTKDEEDVRTICCPWNATRSARMPPGALQRGNQQPTCWKFSGLPPSIDVAPDAPDNAYFKMQMAMKIEEREFGAFDVILTN